VLTIRAEQMEVFSTYMLQQFELRMAAYLREAFADATAKLTDEALQAHVHSGVLKAEGFEITTEGDIRRFLEHVTLRGLDIERNRQTPWVAEALKDPTLTGTEKVNRLDEREPDDRFRR
jgi:hypothetical protein